MAAKKPKRRETIPPRSRALNHLAAGRTPDALAWASEQGDSQSIDDCLSAARIFKSCGEFKQLIGLYLHLQNLQPQAREWYLAEACVLAETGDQEALKQRLSADVLEPLAIDELKLIAGACLDGRQFELAVNFYLQAQQLNPSDAEVTLQLAAALSEAGDREQAAKVLQKFLSEEIVRPNRSCSSLV